MKFEDLFSDKLFLLPKSIPIRKDYKAFLKEVLDGYLNLLESVTQKNLVMTNTKYDLNVSIPKQKKLINGINNAIQHYYDGRPHLAYQVFATTIEERISKFRKWLSIGQYSKGESFYRVRTTSDNHVFRAKEMFHIPFEQRGKVKTQRYSIPGFPSLYLGSSVYVCWEELGRPKIDDFQVVRLELNREITFLDLTNPKFNESEINEEAYRYIMTWPLIAACSIKTKNKEDSFMPEYIIPQMLLQWARDNSEIDGIRYSSTHTRAISLTSHTGLSNLVLPVKTNEEKGYCYELSSMFDVTETISWPLIELISGGAAYSTNKSEMDLLDERVPKLEIIRGVKSRYSITSFGKIERYLGHLKPVNIIF